MSTGDRFTIIVSLLGIMVAGVIGLLVTMIRDHYTLAALAADMRDLVVNKEKEHQGINERLTYLERRELTERRRRDR
jgi:hypothetical protein